MNASSFKMLLYLSFLYCFIPPNFLFSQSLSPGPSVEVLADPTVKNTYIPPKGTQGSASDRAVQIEVNFIDGGGSAWTPAAKAAFTYATSIWEATLTSAVTIEIDARFTDLAPNVLGSAGANQLARNFSASDPVYQEDTWYAIALANKLAGNDLSPSQVDIRANFNRNFNWYFGTDGAAASDQYDFVTVVLHEIGHGVGWFSSANNNQYGAQNSPFIYDRFVANNDGVLLSDFLIDTPAPDLEDFLRSNNLFWQSGSDADGAKLFAPNPWQGGSSISHLDDATFDGTDNALMTHALGFAEAIHNPGALGVAILQDIGWDATLVTGFEDVINIYGFDEECYFENQCTWSNWSELYKEPQYDLEVGDSPYYVFEFIDNEPINGVLPATFEWRLEALYEGGRYVLDKCSFPSCNDGTYWGQVSVTDLLSGLEWSRNLEGKIRAELVLSGMDDLGYHYEVFREVTIRYQPNTPIVEFLDMGSESDCSSVTLSFFANGATGYNILYKATTDPFFFVEIVPPGQYIYTISNLNEQLTYEFRVEAYNEEGAVLSYPLIKEDCKDDIIISPNPPKDGRLFVELENELIESVAIWKIDNPQIRLQQMHGGTEAVLEIDISTLPAGIYNVQVLQQNQEVKNKLLTIL